MLATEIESWALSVVHRVKSGAQIEDARVEVKAEWPSPDRAARRLAAHANAAFSESILWIIGLDEKRGVVGADRNDMASWWPRVASFFDGVAPTLQDLIIPVGDASVVALLVDATRVPYVVRNPAYGKGAGEVELEVPWREGTRVRSARREELLLMVAPRILAPTLEVRAAHFTVSKDASTGQHRAQGVISIYIIPARDERIVIPFHRCQVTVASGDSREELLSDRRPTIRPQQRSFPFNEGDSDQRMIAATRSELMVDGPGRFDVETYTRAVDPEHFADQIALVLRVHLGAVRVPTSLTAEAKLVRTGSQEKHQYWALLESL